MLEDKNTPKAFELFRISIIQLTILSFSFILLSIFSQLAMATVAYQNRLPENLLDLSEEERTTFQNKIAKEFESLAKNHPEKIADEFIEATTNTTPSLLLIQNILWFVSFLIPAYFVFTRFLKDDVQCLNDELSFTHINRGLMAGISVFIILMLVSLVFYVFNFKPKVNHFQTKLFTNIKGNFYLLAWCIYTVGIITGIMEEFLFRGLMLNHFVKKGYAKEGLMITSFIFGIMHFSFDASPVIPAILTFVGVLFGSIYLQSRNIWTVMATHACYNSLGLITAYFLGDKLL
ncbi:MAG TPA: CPBP family intramembrane metalloprotease [Leptospiraceae bacterium]|nr:CPBP family intramembrane metalloprotease [Leptospiraceae bacterium]HMW04565.1 CPBP family intramembrane metalloprotease [Leptospiraceae bacterium]HMX33440.1 CPBP family intramembrane metalloprotease [Leptospiraceae bacterium]HMY30751.1 CPBP family intramembrane metalloprotease [Leptospiraceae bacterium]HMZ64329.1 CPBP family intramembrane metalloprotease [Leptospiraceae bacterium]